MLFGRRRTGTLRTIPRIVSFSVGSVGSDGSVIILDSCLSHYRGSFRESQVSTQNYLGYFLSLVMAREPSPGSGLLDIVTADCIMVEGYVRGAENRRV